MLNVANTGLNDCRLGSNVNSREKNRKIGKDDVNIEGKYNCDQESKRTSVWIMCKYLSEWWESKELKKRGGYTSR